MSALVPEAFARTRDLLETGMRDAVERLSPGIRRVVAYHLGWLDLEGDPVESPSGKFVRPALSFVCAEAVGASAEVALPGAVAVELVHDFSLLHDDVMDRDTERRHRPTAWTVFGEGEAILAGDALLALAQERLIDPPTPERLKAAAALSEATAEMITGQSEDLAFERRGDVVLAECVAMLEHKTAGLLACACRLGAILGRGSDEQVEALGGFGRALGIAFQMVDDVLGTWGRPEVTGKQAWSDLRQRKKTMPVVAAIEADGPSAEQLLSLLQSDGEMTEEDIARLARLVEDNGGRDRTLEEAERTLARALRFLDQIDTPADARRDLEAIAGFITARDF
jgi:geranylgeranyl diphosphate synthase type I